MAWASTTVFKGGWTVKYGVNSMVWTTRVGHAEQSLFSRIKQWGYDGVELFLSPQEPADITAVKNILDELHLERTTCSVIPKEANLISARPEVRKLGSKFLLQCIERTAELGARLICGPLYAGLGVMTGKRRTEDEWKWAAESLHVAARRGQELGVTLCIEPLNRFETYFLNTLSDAVELIHFIGEPNVRIHFDTFHANIEERNLRDSILATGKDIGHVHISENDRGIPGTGHVDWQGTFSALKESGFEGWLTIESFAQPEPELAAAAAIWRDLAPSGDELARQGLAFIREMSRKCGIE